MRLDTIVAHKSAGWHTVSAVQAENFMLRSSHQEAFAKELADVANKRIPKCTGNMLATHRSHHHRTVFTRDSLDQN